MGASGIEASVLRISQAAEPSQFKEEALHHQAPLVNVATLAASAVARDADHVDSALDSQTNPVIPLHADTAGMPGHYLGSALKSTNPSNVVSYLPAPAFRSPRSPRHV